MQLSDIYSLNIGLSVVTAAQAGFSVPLLLVDTDDVPVDRRYIITDKSSYATDLTADSDADEWCTTLWAQSMGGPDQAYIGRWVSADTPAQFVCGSPGTIMATYAAVVAGDFGLTIGGVPTVLVTTATMADVTSLADVAALMQTAIQALAGDWATCTVEIDALNRFVLSNSTTGADSEAVTITAATGGAGTDISAAGYLNIASGAFSVAGLDAEDPDDALAAILALDNTPFIVNQRSGSIAQKVDLATACAVYKKMFECMDTDENSKDAVETTDVAYQLKELSNNNAHITYTEHTTQNPDAAICGECHVRPEGQANIARIGLSSVYASGLDLDGTTVIEMTATEEAALEGKGCDWLGNPAGVVHLKHGLTPGGVEVRHRIALYWAEARSQEMGYATLLAMAGANKPAVFSDEDITSLAAPIKYHLDILVKRKVIEPDYVLNLPSAADITAVTKATHTLTLSDLANLTAQWAINDVAAAMTATV